MQPLLRISSVPISIEYKVTRAALRHDTQPAQVNVNRARGNYSMQTSKPQLNIDSTEAKANMGLKTAPRLAQEFAAKGMQAASDATRAYAEQGDAILDSHGKGNPVAEMAASQSIAPAPSISAAPYTPPQITVEPGTISFDFTMDRLNFDWNINNKPFLEFVPGGIEFSVTQYPDVNIEYVGEPIYAPPSANPNYEPPPLPLNSKV